MGSADNGLQWVVAALKDDIMAGTGRDLLDLYGYNLGVRELLLDFLVFEADGVGFKCESLVPDTLDIDVEVKEPKESDGENEQNANSAPDKGGGKAGAESENSLSANGDSDYQRTQTTATAAEVLDSLGADDDVL